jgi:hypothetical protein
MAATVTVPEPNRVKSEAEAQVAPGQLLKHYAPDAPTYIAAGNEEQSVAQLGGSLVVVDFGGCLAWAKTRGKYVNLSPSGNGVEAATNLFAALRWAETEAGAGATVLVPDLSAAAKVDEAVAAVWDRLFRSASGKLLGLASTFSNRQL